MTLTTERIKESLGNFKKRQQFDAWSEDDDLEIITAAAEAHARLFAAGPELVEAAATLIKAIEANQHWNLSEYHRGLVADLSTALAELTGKKDVGA